MASPEQDDLLRARVRRGYELGRLRRAVAGAAPVLIAAIVSVAASQRPWSAASFGMAAVGAAVTFLWWGREPQRAVLPAMAAGLIPLAMALAASHWHACGPGGCTSFCVPACTAGGVLAGLAIAGIGLKRRAGMGFWLAASGLAVLEGAMGCSCVGGGGVVGLMAGFSLGLVPAVVRRWSQRA